MTWVYQITQQHFATWTIFCKNLYTVQRVIKEGPGIWTEIQEVSLIGCVAVGWYSSVGDTSLSPTNLKLPKKLKVEECNGMNTW